MRLHLPSGPDTHRNRPPTSGERTGVAAASHVLGPAAPHTALGPAATPSTSGARSGPAARMHQRPAARHTLGGPVASSITIRPALAGDEPALARLAAIDSARVPPPPVVLAEVDGELRAAVSESGGAIADPFFPTAYLLALLRLHSAAEQAARPGRPRRVLRPRLA